MEYHGGRSVVQECRECTRAIYELPRLVYRQRVLLEEHQRGSHRRKDAQEHASHLQDGHPTVTVVLANLLGCGQPTQGDDGNEYPLAQQLQVPRSVVLAHSGDVRRVDEERTGYHAQQPEDVDQSRELHLPCLTHVGHDVHRRLFAVQVRIHNEVHEQQQTAGHKPLDGHVLHPPHERRSLLEQQEQWWVTQRRQQTAAVGYDSDEEQHGVNLVLALRDRLQQQSDEQHGRTGRTHERCQHPADRHDDCVGRRGGFQVTADTDAAGGHEQGHQQ